METTPKEAEFSSPCLPGLIFQGSHLTEVLITPFFPSLFQTHSSRETYMGLESKLWKRGQANAPGSQAFASLPSLHIWPKE